jgi:hypothetical protein
MFKQLTFQTWAPIPWRLIVGLGFMQHGYAKLLNRLRLSSRVVLRQSYFVPHLTFFN